MSPPALNYNQPQLQQQQQQNPSVPKHVYASAFWLVSRQISQANRSDAFCLGAGFEYGCQETAQLPAGKNGWVIDCRASGKNTAKRR
jgi:hypothetical protein